MTVRILGLLLTTTLLFSSQLRSESADTPSWLSQVDELLDSQRLGLPTIITLTDITEQQTLNISLKHSAAPEIPLSVDDNTLIVWRSKDMPAAKSQTVRSRKEWLNVAAYREQQWHLLMSIVIHDYSEKYGGISYLDQLQLTHDRNNLYPIIGITVTSLPADGDRDFRPGPPVMQLYRFDDDASEYLPIDSLP